MQHVGRRQTGTGTAGQRRSTHAALRDIRRISRGASPRAFTLVELVVVITVIILILAIAVPGLSAMNAEARLTSAQQMIQGTTREAYGLALESRTMTAVRFFPGEWDTIDPSQKRSPGGRQHLAVYSYFVNTLDFTGYFERAKDLASMTMPVDVWAAPLEALSVNSVTLSGTNYSGGTYDVTYYPFGPEFVLSGQVNQFRFDAARDAGGDGVDFLNADDFLIVCDPETGVRAGTPTPFRLRAFAPTPTGYDVDKDPATGNWYRRYSFSGVVTYHREPFVALPVGPTLPSDRQKLLQESGRAFMVHRFSGGLVEALQRPPQ